MAIVSTSTLKKIKEKRKVDAIALAELAYDMYKEQQASGKIKNGQNNAQSSNN